MRTNAMRTAGASDFSRPGLGGAFAVPRHLAGRLAVMLRLWAERDRERLELARMDRGVRRELQARGLDPEHEACKPFWKD